MPESLHFEENYNFNKLWNLIFEYFLKSPANEFDRMFRLSERASQSHKHDQCFNVKNNISKYTINSSFQCTSLLISYAIKNEIGNLKIIRPISSRYVAAPLPSRVLFFDLVSVNNVASVQNLTTPLAA